MFVNGKHENSELHIATGIHESKERYAKKYFPEVYRSHVNRLNIRLDLALDCMVLDLFLTS